MSVSIRAPREGGDSGFLQVDIDGKVSIRAPREGGDMPSSCPKQTEEFQSAPPVKGATLVRDVWIERRDVSIRAPREGGDFLQTLTECLVGCFNPRPP